MKIRIRKTCFLCLFCLLLVTGCGKQEEAGETAEYRVAAVLPENSKIRSTDFWTYVWDGVHDSVEAAGILLSEYMCEEDTSISVTLDLALSAEVEGVILAPSADSDEEPFQLLEDARAEGTKIVIVDTDIGEAYYDVFVGIDNTMAGESLAQYVIAHSEKEDGILLLEPEASGAVEQRKQAFCEALEEAGLEARIVSAPLREETEERLMDIQEAIEEADGLEWIVSFDPSCTIQAAETLSRMQLASQISLIGFGESDSAEEYLREGTITALLVQDNYNMGVIAVEKMRELLDGDVPETTHYYVTFELRTCYEETNTSGTA